MPESFTLDSASNITARTGPAATYAIDTANRPTSDGNRTFTWSNADRLTGRGADLFGYDALDRLTSSTVAGAARSYTYNGDSLLQSRSGANPNPETFLWDPSSSPSRLLQQGSDRIVYGLGPLYIVRADRTTAAFARDGLGSVRAEVSGMGAVSSSFRYGAYGQIRQFSGASTPSLLGYAGELQDPSGLIYLRARWYDPGSGRFLSRDAVDGDPSEPMTLNVYSYANLNPVRFSDPSGRCLTLCTAIIGFVIGGVIGGAGYALQQAAKGEAIDPAKLALNIGLGALSGAAVGAMPLSAVGFLRGTAVGAGSGLISDLVSQRLNGDPFSWSELTGSTLGGAAGGFISGGMLTPIAGIKAKGLSDDWRCGARWSTDCLPRHSRRIGRGPAGTQDAPVAGHVREDEMTQPPESARIYEIGHYRAWVYGSAGAMSAIGLAFFALDDPRTGFPTWLPLTGLALYTAFAVYMQQWNPYQVVVTHEGLRLTWTLGVRDVPWYQVARIELPPHRFKPGHVAQVAIRLKNRRKYTLQDSLSDFDDLVRRIRRLRPDLIRE